MGLLVKLGMKNILARGGIEFIAVILGISGSLWIDDWSSYKNDREKELETFSRLSIALNEDNLLFEKALKKNARMVKVLRNMIYDFESISMDTLSKFIEEIQYYTRMDPHISDYETLKSTGQLYTILDFDILQGIIDLYDNKYSTISHWMNEDKRAIFLQDEYFLKNYSMKPTKHWSTIKNLEKDYRKLKNDEIFFNYLVLVFNVKSAMNRDWTDLNNNVVKLREKIELKIH